MAWVLRADEVEGIAMWDDTKLNAGEDVKLRMLLETVVWLKPV